MCSMRRERQRLSVRGEVVHLQHSRRHTSGRAGQLFKMKGHAQLRCSCIPSSLFACPSASRLLQLDILQPLFHSSNSGLLACVEATS